MKFLIPTLVVTILILAGLLSFESSNMENYIGWYKSTPLEKIQLLVNNDFSNSIKKNEFPKEWESLKGYKTTFHSPIAEYFFGSIKIPLKSNPKGEFYTKVDIVDIPDTKNPGFLVQFSIINLKTNDKVEEFSKDYYLNELETLPEFAQLFK
ncbi:MAG TPA: hypothetical protein PLJ21_08340 [Pseudobdellovibrionaceae bacterium]|nr:hypothetical protein [Pseudobdellovibrionaceae bacterium]